MPKKYAKLHGRICELYGTQNAFAGAMDMNPGTLSRKLNGHTDWTREDIEQAKSLLKIPTDELASYFF